MNIKMAGWLKQQTIIALISLAVEEVLGLGISPVCLANSFPSLGQYNQSAFGLKVPGSTPSCKKLTHKGISIYELMKMRFIIQFIKFI